VPGREQTALAKPIAKRKNQRRQAQNDQHAPALRLELPPDWGAVKATLHLLPLMGVLQCAMQVGAKFSVGRN
jgi:hypothetical protein